MRKKEKGKKGHISFCTFSLFLLVLHLLGYCILRFLLKFFFSYFVILLSMLSSQIVKFKDLFKVSLKLF